MMSLARRNRFGRTVTVIVLVKKAFVIKHTLHLAVCIQHEA